MNYKLLIIFICVLAVIISIYILIRLGFTTPCIESPDNINPIDFVVTQNSANSILLSWKKINSATSYNVYTRKQKVVSNTEYDFKANTKNTRYIFNGLDTGIQWYFTVEPINSCGVAKYTPPKIAVPCIGTGDVQIVNATVTTAVGNYTSEINPYFVQFTPALNAKGYDIQLYKESDFNQPPVIISSGYVSSEECSSSSCELYFSSSSVPSSGSYTFVVTPKNTCFRGNSTFFNID